MTPELAKRVFDVFVSLEERRGKALTQAIADVFPDMPEGMRESIGFDVRKFFHSAEGDEPFVLPENMAQIFIAACRRQGIPIDKLSDVVTKNENDGSLTLDLPTIFAASEQFKEGRKPG